MPNDTHSTKLADALAELIALKDLKDDIQRWVVDDATGHQWPQMQPYARRVAASNDYDRRKPLAWDAARNALATYRAGDGTRAVPEWQPIETCPQDGYFLIHEDSAVRLKLRIKGEWHEPGYPAIVGEWGDKIVGDDAKRLTGGRPLTICDGVGGMEPTEWMECPASPSPSTEPAQAQEGQS